jgi:hypothetical protein
LKEPRWEDFNFIRDKAARRNRFEFFGNGWTQKDVRGDEGEITGYLKGIGEIDPSSVHEAWNE